MGRVFQWSVEILCALVYGRKERLGDMAKIPAFTSFSECLWGSEGCRRKGR